MSSTTRSRTGGIDGFFHITERGSTPSAEIRGGVVTFFTMAYIVVLNPLIIGIVAGRRRASSSAAATRPTSPWSPLPLRWSPAS